MADASRHKKAAPYREERLQGWGMTASGRSLVARPRDPAGIQQALGFARQNGLSIGLRGAGCSYGDAALNQGGLVLDLSSMNRMLDFDPAGGLMTAESGVTIEQIWRRALPEGFWLPVVPGTMRPTLGGCAAMNIHGKNNIQEGTLGEHLESFELMTHDGELVTCSRRQHPELFHGAIGGFGMLGVFTKLTLRLKPVTSGDLVVRAVSRPNLQGMLEFFEAEAQSCDYLVGWVDAFPGGKKLGRGLIHQAWYRKAGEDPHPEESLLAAHQVLPARFLGVIPKSWMWLFLWLFLNRPGMRLVNALKCLCGRLEARRPPLLQSLVGFSFLLDYVPNWKYAYKPGGLIQYQSFIPREAALPVFTRLLRMAQEQGIPPYLGVLKRHRKDPFLLTHAVDGYSLALDFPVKTGTRKKVWRLAAAMDPVVTEAGGRFYFAKDSTLSTQTLKRAWPKEKLKAFGELKKRIDPHLLFQTNLFRRLFLPLFEEAPASLPESAHGS